MVRSAMAILAPLPLAAAVPSLAQADMPAAPEAGQADEAPRPEERICRRIPVTGSYTRHRRICMTESEWAEQSRRNQETARGSLGRTSVSDGRTDASAGAPCCD